MKKLGKKYQISVQEMLAEAIQYHKKNQLERAELLYRQILKRQPEQPDALNLLGVIACQTGEPQQAVTYIQKAIALQATSHYYLNLGNAYQQMGHFDAAITAYQQALNLKPHLAEAHHNLGHIFKQIKNYAQALHHYRQALNLVPNAPEAHCNLGHLYQETENWEQAIACYQAALAIQPNNVQVRYYLGNAFRNQGAMDQAKACYKAVIEQYPDHAHAHNSLGNLYQLQGLLEPAIVEYQRTLTLAPDFADAYNNLGTAFQELGQLGNALATYNYALKLNPQFVDAHMNRGMTLLLQGNLSAGWPEYEWRWRQPETPPRNFPQPLWDGSALQGKTILLHAEQGFGDSIQFVRYVNQVSDLGGSVLLECQPELVRLFQTLPNIDTVLPHGQPLPPFDTHAPLVSLPGIFKTTIETIPQGVDLGSIKSSNSPTPKTPKIGITWAAGHSEKPDMLQRYRKKSCPLALFLSLSQPGIELYSLQVGIDSLGVDELESWGVREFDRFQDFYDTALAIAELDLIISVDTAVAHLAGAMGKPTWLLLPDIPDWRWMLEREDSPWYPTMRLFRQPKRGDWEAVFDRLREALNQNFLE